MDRDTGAAGNASGPIASHPRQTELHGLQILRALAAIVVVLHHTLEESNGASGRFSPDWLTTAGAAGVDIFFVISGFVMFYVSFRADVATPRPGSFLFRRITRIYPFYWLCCLAVLILHGIGLFASLHIDAATIAASFLLLPGATLIGVAWTLVYEVYFYIVFAAMLVFARARIVLFGTIATIIVLMLASRGLPDGAAATFLASPLPIEFCFGLAIAYAYVTNTRRGRRWPIPPVAVAGGLALLILAPLFVAHNGTQGLPPLSRLFAWGVPAALVVAGALTIGPPRTAVARFGVWLGNASYALYLTHVFVMIGYARLIRVGVIDALPQAAIVPVIVVIATAVGLIAHEWVEKPLLGLIRRMTHREPGHVGTAVPPETHRDRG